MRFAAITLMALAMRPADAGVLTLVPGSTQGFVGFTVNEIGPPLAGVPLIVANPLAPSGLVRNPGGGLRGSAGPAPLFNFTDTVPLPVSSSANGGDPAGRFGVGSGAVSAGDGTIVFDFSLADLIVGDNFSSSLAARGAATFINSTNTDVLIPSIGLTLSVNGTMPSNGLGYAGLTGLVNGASVRPAVLGMTGTDSSNAFVAFGDVASLTYGNGGTTFSGYAVSFLRDGNGGIASLLLRPGDTISLDFALSLLMDPGAGFQLAALPQGVALPAFGATAVSQAPVPEPGSVLLVAVGLAWLLWRRRRPAACA